MASTHEDGHYYYKYAFHVLSPSENQQNPINQSSLFPPTNSDHVLPVLAIAVLSIMGTACLLFCYYVVLNKCYSNRHQINMLRWLTTRRTRRSVNSLVSLSPPMWNRGLDQSVIREIPTIQYRSREGEKGGCIYGCVVCLNEFQEKDMLRVLPSCSHAFHLDCIDIWLQSNGNCPLCRTSISGTSRYPVDHINAPASSPQGSPQFTDSLMGGDEDFVVIELGGSGDESVLLAHGREQETENSGDVQIQLRGQSPILKIMERELENAELKPRKHHHVSIMGDECIDVRGRDDQFSIQPLRRSFSLDSAADQQIYLSVQAIIQQNARRSEIKITEETSNRGQRSFFPFVHGRGSRKAVLPVEFGP